MAATINGHEELMTRIAIEYIEMPDLMLSGWQAQRLWNVSADACERALAALVARGFLAQTPKGVFVKRNASVN